MSKKLLVDTRWKGYDGIARYSNEILARLDYSLTVDSDIKKLSALEPLKLTRDAIRQKADVYYSPGFNPPLQFSGKLIFTIHDLMHLRVPEHRTITKWIYYELVVKRGVKNAYKVITDCEYTKNDIVEWTNVHPDKIIVASCGVNKIYQRRNSNQFSDLQPFLLFVGNIRHHKNVNRLFESFAKADRPPELKLVLTGNIKEEQLHLLNRLGIRGSVEYIGFIPEEDLPALYSSAIALAIPSLFEGFGLPALEAMACGTPVIAANATSLPEVVGDAALLIDPHSTNSIKNAIESLIDNKILRAQLSQRGLVQAKKFNWDKTFNIVESVIKTALC